MVAKLGDAEGVLVLHPVSATKPASVKLKFSATESRGKVFSINARGSDTEPGVLLKITSQKKTIKEVQLGRKWESLDIPISELPPDAQEVTVEIHAVGWFNEYVYIDFLGLK